MSPGPATDRLRCWLAVNRVAGLAAHAAAELVHRCAGPCAVFDLGRVRGAGLDLPAAALQGLRAPDWAGAERDLRWLEGSGRHVLTIDQPHYPPLLRAAVGAPPLLFVEGDPGLLVRPQLAIVGSRRASAGAVENAAAFARAATGCNLVVTSGLALGIDTAAHRGALESGGCTVAVMGTGPDRLYPARNRELAARIRESGALVSEFPVGTAPRAEHFPRRNRIISGLALGVLVVEAARRSGSLITARHALEQGREVFAVPGSIRNPLASGCHALIRDGATLTETFDDVLAQLGPQLAPELGIGSVPGAGTPGAAPQAARAPADAHARTLLECIGYDPVSVDVLVARSGLTASRVCSILLALELQGHVRAEPGGVFVRR